MNGSSFSWVTETVGNRHSFTPTGTTRERYGLGRQLFQSAREHQLLSQCRVSNRGPGSEQVMCHRPCQNSTDHSDQFSASETTHKWVGNKEWDWNNLRSSFDLRTVKIIDHEDEYLKPAKQDAMKSYVQFMRQWAQRLNAEAQHRNEVRQAWWSLRLEIIKEKLEIIKQKLMLMNFGHEFVM